MGKMRSMISVELIEKRIYLVRGQRVMLDRDLAEIYGVSTKRLNEQVRRNRQRFPEGFMIRLTFAEAQELLASRSHFATLKKGQNIKYRPHVFTEHGVVMLASVLNSPTAVAGSLHVVRAFVRLRQMVATHSELRAKLQELERRVEKHDEGIRSLFDAIAGLLDPPQKPRQSIGFKPKS